MPHHSFRHGHGCARPSRGARETSPPRLARSPVIKRSVIIGGHKTSISLEDAFWASLKDIAQQRGLTLSTLVAAIDGTRQNANLSSAIRLFVLDHFRARALSAVFIGERGAARAAAHPQAVIGCATE